MFGKGTGGLGNKRTSGDNLYYSIVEGGQNTEESPGDVKRFVVTQTRVKNHQLRLERKILKKVKKIICLETVIRF